MAAQFDSEQLKKLADAKLAFETSMKADLNKENSSIPKPKASPRRGSFVDKLKEDSESGKSPRKSKTPDVSPLFSFSHLKIIAPTHLDLASAVTQHFDSASSAPEQPHTSEDKAKSNK